MSKVATAKQVQERGPDAELRKKGYVPAAEIARRLGKDISTVHRWMDNGDVEGEVIMDRRYVLLRSVIVEKIGVRQSVLIGLITEEQAKQFVNATPNKKKGE